MSRRRAAPLRFVDPFDPLDGPIADTIDLHGFRREEARLRVIAVVTSAHRKQRGELIHIITGKGRHSPDGAVLKGAVKTVLKGDVAPMIKAFGPDLDDGGYLVRVRQGDS